MPAKFHSTRSRGSEVIGQNQIFQAVLGHFHHNIGCTAVQPIKVNFERQSGASRVNWVR